MPDDRTVSERADLLPEERTAGVEDPHATAEAVLADSEMRQETRNETGGDVERRRS